jgi:hypothetical protein
MGIEITVAVNTVADLQAVDLHIRTLCRTTPGAQCQAILTTEYQCWRRRVALFLQQRDRDPQASLPQALDAYLNGFRLRFVPRTCVISQTTPTTELPVADCQRKRKSCVGDVAYAG